MKRRIPLLVALLVVALVAVACGGNSEVSSSDDDVAANSTESGVQTCMELSDSELEEMAYVVDYAEISSELASEFDLLDPGDMVAMQQAAHDRLGVLTPPASLEQAHNAAVELALMNIGVAEAMETASPAEMEELVAQSVEVVASATESEGKIFTLFYEFLARSGTPSGNYLGTIGLVSADNQQAAADLAQAALDAANNPTRLLEVLGDAVDVSESSVETAEDLEAPDGLADLHADVLVMLETLAANLGTFSDAIYAQDTAALQQANLDISRSAVVQQEVGNAVLAEAVVAARACLAAQAVDG